MLFCISRNQQPPAEAQESPAAPPLPEGESLRRRRGATMMEYLAVASLILLAVISAVGYFGQESKKIMQDNADTIQTAIQDPDSPDP